MKTTRMRMTKNAAAMIHKYRNKHGYTTNAEAIYGLVSDLDVLTSGELYWSNQIKLKNEHVEALEARLDLLVSRRDNLKERLDNAINECYRKNDVINKLHSTSYKNGKWMIAAKGKMLILAILAFVGWGGFISMMV